MDEDANPVFSFDFPWLAWRNVRYGGTRSLAAIAGVCLALAMVLLQLGFLQAVRFTAVNIYQQLDFDAALIAPNYEQFFDTATFPRQRLRQAEALPEVSSASPLYVTMSIWRCPPAQSRSDQTGVFASLQQWWSPPRPLQMRELLVLGIDLERNPFRGPIAESVERHRDELKSQDRILMNELSNPEFGWQRRDDYDDWELGLHAVSIVGGFPLLRSFGADASVLCSDWNFSKFCRWDPEKVCIGLVKVDGASAEEVAELLNRRLPDDVLAMTRKDLEAREETHWVRHTATGEIFGFGVVVSMVVAGVVIFQVLSSDIRNHLSEYATLKAMGYTNAFLGRVVVRQSLIYSVSAYVLAIPLGIASYALTEYFVQIPMHLTAANLLYVFALTVATGWISARISISKVYSASPADLY